MHTTHHRSSTTTRPFVSALQPDAAHQILSQHLDREPLNSVHLVVAPRCFPSDLSTALKKHHDSSGFWCCNGANDQISSILAHLNEQAPILPRNSSVTDIVIHRPRMVNICKECGCTEYVIGPLAQNPDLLNTQPGKSFYLSAFEDPNLRGLVASKGQSLSLIHI